MVIYKNIMKTRGDYLNKNLYMFYIFCLIFLVSCTSLNETNPKKEIQNNISDTFGTNVPVPELKGYSITSAFYTGTKKPKMVTWYYSKIDGKKQKAEDLRKASQFKTIYGPYKGNKVASVEVESLYQKGIFDDSIYTKKEIQGKTIYTREVVGANKYIINIPMNKVLIRIVYFLNDDNSLLKDDFYDFAGEFISQYKSLNK